MAKSKTVVAATVAPAAKAPKVTLNSIVLAPVPTLPVLKEGETHSEAVLTTFESDVAAFVQTQGSALASYLVDKASDNVSIISRIFAAAAAEIPAVLEREAENIAARKADLAGKREAKRLEREKAEAAAAAADEEQKKLILQTLLDSGVDLAVANEMILARAKAAKKLAKTDVTSYDRVTVEYKGTQYDMPIKGNMSQALKDAFAESGEADRESFIAKYKVATDANAETETAGE